MKTASLIALLIVVVGCSDRRSTAEPASPESLPAAIPVSPETPLGLVITARDKLCQSTENLERQVTLLAQSPGPTQLSDARLAWQAAHRQWRLWRLLKQVATGMESRAEPTPAASHIDAQPILPGYLDRVPGYPVSGLVFSEVPLEPSALTQAHQSTDPFYVVLGFHPLEFMLWGVRDESGNPTRKPEAFRDRAEPDSETIAVPARRRTLITNVAGVLNVSLAPICAPAQSPDWLPALAESLEEADRRDAIVRWLGSLSEQMANWEQNPDGEDRNGMPIWHSAFARTDFQEINAELDWLIAHQWPQDHDQTLAAPLSEALGQLLQPQPGEPPADSFERRLTAVTEAAVTLAEALSPPAPEGVTADTEAAPADATPTNNADQKPASPN